MNMRSDTRGSDIPNAPSGFRSRSALAALGAVGLLVGAAGHVSAASGGFAPYFAGYVAAPSAGIASASATFKVPTVNCSDGNSWSQSWGVFLEGDSLAPDAFAYVDAACDGTMDSDYYFALDAAGNGVDDPGASPGDTVVVSAWQTTSIVEAEVHDLTNHDYWFANASPASPGEAAYFGDQNPDGGISPFTTVTFTKCQINGDYLGFESPIQYSEKTGRDTQISTGKLGSPGDTFKLTFKHES